jgi:RNA polymerase sigma factor (sigma-70 family)
MSWRRPHSAGSAAASWAIGRRHHDAASPLRSAGAVGLPGVTPWHTRRTYLMRDYLLVTDLVARAGNGEKQAWDALVERYSPLIWSICLGHRLGDADTDAVGLRVWRQLVRQLDEVPDPGALAGWLAAAAWRECGNVRSAAGAPQISGEIAGSGRRPSHQAGTAEHEWLIAERHATLREAFSRLSPCCQQLLTLLVDGPSMPDTQISARLGIPAGSIGAARLRCLEKLRRDPAVAALTSAGTVAREMPGRAAGDDHQHNASSGPARDVAPLRGEGTE